MSLRFLSFVMVPQLFLVSHNSGIFKRLYLKTIPQFRFVYFLEIRFRLWVNLTQMTIISTTVGRNPSEEME